MRIKDQINGLPRPLALVYDWDNTLVDNWSCIHLALNTTLKAMGHDPWSMEETLIRVRASMRDSFPKLFGDRAAEARDIFYRTFEQNHIEELKVLEGADELLEACAMSGIYQAVVSNKRGDLLRKEAMHLDWEAYMGALLGANDADQDKPDPLPVRMALDPCGLEPGPDVWFIGDTPIDVECARNAGCTAILVWNHTDLTEELKNNPPDHHFPDLESLQKALGV